MNKTQQQAILTAYLDLKGALECHDSQDWYSHDWRSHAESIEDLESAFPAICGSPDSEERPLETGKKYNSMIDVAFTVEHSYEDLDQLLAEGQELVIQALRKRLESLESEYTPESFGVVDTYEIDDI